MRVRLKRDRIRLTESLFHVRVSFSYHSFQAPCYFILILIKKDRARRFLKQFAKSSISVFDHVFCYPRLFSSVVNSEILKKDEKPRDGCFFSQPIFLSLLLASIGIETSIFYGYYQHLINFPIMKDFTSDGDQAAG